MKEPYCIWLPQLPPPINMQPVFLATFPTWEAKGSHKRSTFLAENLGPSVPVAMDGEKVP